jgi:hypothetical protein
MALTEAGVERRLLNFVDRWLGTYVRLQCEQEGRDATRMVVPAPTLRYDATQRFAAAELPAVVVDVPSPLPPAESGRGAATWDAWVPVRVTVVTGGGRAIARDDAGTYLGALRELFVTQQSVDGLAAGVTYVSDGLDDAPAGQSTATAYGTLDVQLLIRGIADRRHLGDGSEPPPRPDPQHEPDVPVDGLEVDLDATTPDKED